MTKFPRISVMVPKITKMKNAKKRKTWNWRKPYDPHAEVRKMQARKVGFLARFREIYKAGPYGEGQKFWWQVRRTGKQRKARKRAERQPNQYIKRPDTPAISHPNGTKPKLLPAAEPHTQRRQRSDEVSHSVLMTTSAELPLTVSPMVQFDAETTTRERYVDTSKPLPPVPVLNAPPRARVNKTLPASPEAPNPPPKSPLRKAPCLSSPRGPRFVTLGDIQKTKPNKKAKVRKQSHTSIWLAGKSDLLFNRREGNSASKGHSKQNRQQTRPKISRPFNVVTDGLEIYTNGEGGSAGPSAPKVGLPANPKVFKQSEEAPWRPQRPGEAKGKSSHHLRDLWANYQDNSLSKFFNIASNPYRRRSSSESSFACQGIDVSMRDSHYPYLTQAVGQAARGNPGTSSRRRTKSMDNAREGVVPAPLFSGPRSGLEGRQGVSRGVSVKRDTSFYQPYDDFLHEYRG
ncbi:hypothetical protein EJ04DRAFT_514026 [Polyplosphaeria fusca]|uniref:Uncharacterized protein n=1 Tax=Polyplosphaeria fusca TaxID=682080 RepID=A0A9P4QVX6_9PLEO|nr:hypothetical protein EJ04DRAFT_514026 [Polyplosphaeria fusca]